jgi:hypothetical protein
MSRKPNLFADSQCSAARPETAAKTAASDVHCHALLLNRDNTVSLFRHNLLTTVFWLSCGSTKESGAPHKLS